MSYPALLLEVKPVAEYVDVPEYAIAVNNFNKHVSKVEEFTFGNHTDAVDARIALASVLNDLYFAHKQHPTKDESFNILSCQLRVFRTAARYYLNPENMRDLDDFLSLYSYFTFRILEAEELALKKR